MRPPTCSECAHWEWAPVMSPAKEARACLKGYRLVEADTLADIECFDPITRDPGAPTAPRPRE